jgi:1-acyl-sn-glycerol-3-phosphate acyltransferase
MKVRLWYRCWRRGCRIYFSLLHFGRVYNRHYVPNEGPLLIVSNHQSFYDPMLVGYGLAREVDYMARDTLFKNERFGKFIRSVNAFPVKRGEADLAAIKETLRRLKDQRAVLLFPEGTRTLDGRISEFKTGVVLLAKKANCPIVPVVIDGAFDVWPRSSKRPKYFTSLGVMYGKPFSPEEVKSCTPEEFVKIVHQRMIGMQNELRLKRGKEPYNYETPVLTEGAAQ